jgi:hypothetical protein
VTDELLEPPPESTGADRVYAAARIGGNLVPYVGGAAVELLDAVLGPPLARRQQAWWEKVAEAIRVLQANHIPVDGDEFVTAVAQASRIALGTHLDEKLEMLKAAIIHSALPDRPSDLLTLRFLRFVDELEPEHFIVLTYLRDPVGHFERHGIEQPNVLSGAPSSIMDMAQLPLEEEARPLLLADLGERRLVNASSMGTMMTGRGAWQAQTTGLGNLLLDFVTYIEPSASQ